MYETKTKTVENSLKMLNLLKQHEYMTVQELKKELDIPGSRTIYRYKSLLEQFGYEIEGYIRNKKGYKLIQPEKLTYEEICYLGELIPSKKINIFIKIQKLNNMIK